MLRRATVAVFVVGLLSASVRADPPDEPDWHLTPKPKFIFVPNPKRPAKFALVVELTDSTSKQTGLSLPRSLVVEQRVELPRDNKAADTRLTGVSRTSLIVAGLALSLAFVGSGLWLARSGKRRAMCVGALTLVGAVVAGVVGCLHDWNTNDAHIMYGDVGSLSSGANNILWGDTLLNIEPKSDSVRLVIERNDFAAFLDGVPVDKSTRNPPNYPGFVANRSIVRPENAVPIHIETSDTDQAARLVIPKSLLAMEHPQAALRLPIPPERIAFSSGKLLPFGIACLLLMFGGVMAVVGKGRRHTFLGLLVATIALGLSSVQLASLRAESPANTKRPVVAAGMVDIEIVERGEAVRLILPRKQLPELAKQLKETPR